MRGAGPLAALGGLLLAAPGAAAEPAPLAAVVHVHSDASTGELSLDALAALAARQGIGALMLAENFLLRVEYGLPPFRALTRVALEERSVLGLGLERYRARVAEAQRRHPTVLLIPGVEVTPHYRWTGGPLGLAMTVHDTQKNLLAFGVADPAALRALPATGNPHARVPSAAAALEALPGLLVLPGAVLLLGRRRARRRRPEAAGRRRLAGALLASVGAVAVVRAWPFTSDVFPPWRDFGVAPHQTVIDHVERAGGLTAWSFPEARDAGERWVGPVRVAWRTDPHPEALLRTARYTAFGALYEDTTWFERPGGGWDRLLGEYAAGERSRPVWALGESGFHGPAARQALGAVQTVFLVDARSEAAVLDALRRGRLYAVQRGPGAALGLTELRLATGSAVARSGETLRALAGAALELRVTVDASAPLGEARATLVRNGVVAGVWSGPPPLRGVHRETFDGRPAYFRVDVRGPAPHRLVSSPIFVREP